MERTADEKAIRKAYRELARKFHPDVNPGDTSAEGKFKEINEAYEVLSDADKRSKYDQLGSSYQQYARNGAPGGFDWGSWAANQQYGGAQGGGFEQGADMSDFFSTIFGGTGGTRQRQQTYKQPIRGRDVEQPVEVTLEEAYNGTTRTIQRGAKQTKIRVPAGAQEGTRIRIAGEGEPGFASGQPGDLFLVVPLKADPRFKVRDNKIDLESDLRIDLYTVVLGGEVIVPTLGMTLNCALHRVRSPAKCCASASAECPI